MAPRKKKSQKSKTSKRKQASKQEAFKKKAAVSKARALSARKKRATRKKGARKKATINLKPAAPVLAVNVAFASTPTTGMTMKVDGVKLATNPQTLQLTPGEHLLEWTFVGPSGASFSITVTGAREPSGPITDQIAPGRTMAAGSYDVLV